MSIRFEGLGSIVMTGLSKAVVGFLFVCGATAWGCQEGAVPAGDQEPPASTAAAPATGESVTAEAESGSATSGEGEPVMETITVAGGCFWCVEALFQELKGVESVTSGYMGGREGKVTYQEVCSGETGHAEVVQIVFDPAQVQLSQILEIFFLTHDPTTLNRQGADFGTQYRSAIFFHNDDQRAIAEEVKQKLAEAQVYPDPIVTEIVPAATFHPAEEYHQDYFRQNRRAGYCQAVIVPKLQKFRKVFKELLKEDDE